MAKQTKLEKLKNFKVTNQQELNEMLAETLMDLRARRISNEMCKGICRIAEGFNAGHRLVLRYNKEQNLNCQVPFLHSSLGLTIAEGEGEEHAKKE